MHSKAQLKYRVPQLEMELEEAWLKWAGLPKEGNMMVAQVKKVP